MVGSESHASLQEGRHVSQEDTDDTMNSIAYFRFRQSPRQFHNSDRMYLTT